MKGQRTVLDTTNPGTVLASVEFPFRYDDGYHVAVEWSKEDAAWLASLTGARAEARPIGTGETKETALADLCCSLACLADALLAEPPRFGYHQGAALGGAGDGRGQWL